MKNNPKVPGSRFLADFIKGSGVSHVFYVEAMLRETLKAMEALGIKVVLAHSEKAAAYMADGFARASRKPGLCLAQSVGAANLAAGLQDPYLGYSPVVAITGRKPPLHQHRNAYQEIDHRAMFAAVTKYNVSVDAPEQLPFLLRQAFREATSGAPRPVHLDLLGYRAQDTEKTELQAEPLFEQNFSRYPAARTVPPDEQVLAAAALLRKAARPVIVTGGGAAISGAQAEVRELAELLAAPVATSLNGKGSINEDHPLSMGIAGTYACGCTNRLIREADLVMFIGSGTGDQVTDNWSAPAPGVPTIQLNIDPAELGRNYPAAAGLAGDAKATLRKLIEVLPPRTGKEPWAEYVRDSVRRSRDEWAPLLASAAVPIRTERLCGEIAKTLPPEAVLVSDTGHAAIWTGSLIPIVLPGQTYLRAAGSLGWALPASLGAKCAVPHRPVICFTGDGGFWYHFAELETARRYGINTVTVINNNRCFSQCSPEIKFDNVDFAAVSREMGCLGIRVERPEELGGALREALAAREPAVLDVVTDPTCRPPAP